MLPTGRESPSLSWVIRVHGGHPVNETEGKAGPSEGSRAEREPLHTCKHELTDTPLLQRAKEVTGQNTAPRNTPLHRGKREKFNSGSEWQD